MTNQIEPSLLNTEALINNIDQPDGLVEPYKASSSTPKLRSILFLQTDWEMGLCRMALQMRSHGHKVRKVAFHTSDYYYRLRGIPVRPFRDKVEQWRSWLKTHTEKHRIDTYILYNNKRTYNVIAEELADELGIEVIIIEQGLIRPLHVTAYSTKHNKLSGIANLWEQTLEGEILLEGYTSLPPQRARVSSKYKFLRFGFFAAISISTRALFPNYQEQQQMKILYHAKALFLGLWRIIISRSRDRKIGSLIAGDWKHQYFMAPLQVHYDKQVLLKSEFTGMPKFIDKVVASFLRNADCHHKLIFKIHPVDRGYRDYKAKIKELNDQIGGPRIYLVDRIDLDQLLANAHGVITINSTVGLTALRHGTPVKVLGEAIYDLKELTFLNNLDAFWKSEDRPCTEKVQMFVKVLESTIQGRGTLSHKCFTDAEKTGIVWPTSVSKIFGFHEF